MSTRENNLVTSRIGNLEASTMVAHIIFGYGVDCALKQ